MIYKIFKYSNINWYLSTLLSLVMLIISCSNTFKMDYIPTFVEIKSKLPEFIVDESQIEGLYGNMDVDSMIFRYTPKFNAQMSKEDILWNIIVKAQTKGWELVERKTSALRFNRFGPMGKFFNAEEVHIIIIQKNLRIYVAWVQADSMKSVSRFEDTTEWRFAKNVIWPKLESYVAQEEKE